MVSSGWCHGGRHDAPKTGGSCPCGTVTRIVAPPRRAAGPPPEVLALLAACLEEGATDLDAAASGLIRERADRLLAVLTQAGLLLSADPVGRIAV